MAYKRSMKILSFGGGVQTVALVAMCVKGKISMPDAAIFADPQWESRGTYEYLEWFDGWMRENGIKLIRTTHGNIRNDALDNTKRFATMPVFTETDEPGKVGMLLRQCTNEYKIQPVHKKVRELLGLDKGEKYKGEQIELWLGISIDEAHRMKDSRTKWVKNVYPLIDAGVSRGDCIEFLRKEGIEVPPKSACIGCPFHSNSYWRNMKNNSPEEWDDVCKFDEALRSHRVSERNKVYLHRSLKPLSEVYLEEDQMDLFGNECEGHCGL